MGGARRGTRGRRDSAHVDGHRGVQSGFDCELTRAVSRATHVPVIASGGGGTPEHFVRVLTEGCADAALAASIFHFGTYTVNQLKEELDKRGIPVRTGV